MKIKAPFFVAAVLTLAPLAHAQEPPITRGIGEAIEHLIMKKMAEQHIPGLSPAIVVDGNVAWSDG